MSWDLFVSAANEVPPPVSQMPDDWKGEPIGSADEVREKISACLPEVDWSDPAWGVFEGAGYSYEFSVSASGECDGFAILVRGRGGAVEPILRLAKRWGWYVLDGSQGEWLHHLEDPSSGWSVWQGYRDGVLSKAR